MTPERRDEIIKLAEDVVLGNVFTDRHINPTDREAFFALIFMAFSLADEKFLETFKAKKPWMVYEYMDKALPRSINGYPHFDSFCFITEGEEAELFKRSYDTFKSVHEQTRKELQGG